MKNEGRIIFLFPLIKIYIQVKKLKNRKNSEIAIDRGIKKMKKIKER